MTSERIEKARTEMIRAARMDGLSYQYIPPLIEFEAAIRADQSEAVRALVEAGKRYRAANVALTALHEKEAVDATGTDSVWAGLVDDAWFEHDRALDAIYAALAPFLSTEEPK